MPPAQHLEGTHRWSAAGARRWRALVEGFGRIDQEIRPFSRVMNALSGEMAFRGRAGTPP